MNYTSLAKTYNVLDYSARLKSILSCYCQLETIEGLTKYQLHEKINNILLQNYEGEEVLKYKLSRYFLKQDNIGAFEVNVNNSRADFLVINGSTKCFEIKSKIDTLYRLEKQAIDYKDVFEYNTIVVDKKHISKLEQLIPNYYGIWAFEGLRKIKIRDAIKSPYIDSKSQIKLFTKKELVTSFGISDKNEIIYSINPVEINNCLKQVLKKRYERRWDFLKKNWMNIMPIDVQFFFSTNVDPQLIYYSGDN